VVISGQELTQNHPSMKKLKEKTQRENLVFVTCSTRALVSMKNGNIIEVY